MKAFDRYLQRKRIEQADKFIKSNAAILDIGCDTGTLFQNIKNKLKRGLGIDPTLNENIIGKNFELISGYFPEDVKTNDLFDVITMLAVIEHFPESVLNNLDDDCAKFLVPGGRVIITVPSSAVDYILKILFFIKIIDGMSLEEHHGYKSSQTVDYFKKNFNLLKKKKFQFGLNNLFVFEKK